MASIHLRRVRQQIRRWLLGRGWDVNRVVTHRVDYWEDPERRDLLSRLDGHNRTLLDAERLQVLCELLNLARNVPGDLAEAGVYQGGSARLIRTMADAFGGQDRELFLLDTFEGMPALATAGADTFGAGTFGDTSPAQVQAYLSDLEHVTVLAGLFSERFPDIADRTFSFVHVDCDLYESARQCTNFFGPRLAPGAVMAFDDYGYKSCPGLKQAVDEWSEEFRRPIVWLPTGQAFTIAS